MPSLPLRDDRIEQYVVNCLRLIDGKAYVQTFGPYTDYESAQRDATRWDGINGFSTEVDTVYPPAHKESLLHPTRIGKV